MISRCLLYNDNFNPLPTFISSHFFSFSLLSIILTVAAKETKKWPLLYPFLANLLSAWGII